jgi:hypothetical protein
MQKALKMANATPGVLDQKVFEARKELLLLNEKVNGNGSKIQIGERNDPTPGDRLFKILLGIGTSTYGPTATNQQSMEIIRSELNEIGKRLQDQIANLDVLSQEIQKAGAPWIENSTLPPLPGNND